MTMDSFGQQNPPVPGADRTTVPFATALKKGRDFLKGYPEDWRDETDRARELPAPPIEKALPRNAVLFDLVPPEKITAGGAPLNAVISSRRSRREFSSAPLTNEELSFLLWSTQGVSEIVKDEYGAGAHHFRTVPSSGARHPFETYLFIRHAENLAPGIYRYLPVKHKLTLLHDGGDFTPALVRACYGQDFIAETAAVFLWSAVPARMEWKYGRIAHKLIAVEAGHVCQNLYLAAESVGAGACAICGYDQNSVDEFLGLDGIEEFVVYMASVGKTV
jgi:SagB-type dehydrogenase family enzyme